VFFSRRIHLSVSEPKCTGTTITPWIHHSLYYYSQDLPNVCFFEFEVNTSSSDPECQSVQLYTVSTSSERETIKPSFLKTTHSSYYRSGDPEFTSLQHSYIR